MTNADYPLFAYSRKGFDLRVYRDRVEVSERKLLKPEIHIYRMVDIARVAVKDTPARLHIILKDGTGTAYHLTGNAVAAHSAITELL
jgi:hypothetical protein